MELDILVCIALDKRVDKLVVLQVVLVVLLVLVDLLALVGLLAPYCR